MTPSDSAVVPRAYAVSDADPRFVDPDEFIEEPVPIVWLDNAVDIDASSLEDVPGPGLAEVLDGTDPKHLDGDGLLTAISAWRRLGSWAKAGELAAIAAFLKQRTNGRPGTQAFESAVSELQLELTLTGFGVNRLLELTFPLSDRLPKTLEALRRGQIDEAKAAVIARAVEGVMDSAAVGAVEAQVLPNAPSQTTGQLRHAVERAVIQADPQAAERRRRRAEAGRRVEIRPTDAHTADLCGRDLPADQALAADQRITALAKALKHDGDPHSLTFLRAQVFTGLLLGIGPISTWPPADDLPDQATTDDLADTDLAEDGAGADDDIPDEPDTHAHGPQGSGNNRNDSSTGPSLQMEPTGHGPGKDAPASSGSISSGTGVNDPVRSDTGPASPVHVIVSIETLLGVCDRPGEVPGYGAVPASVARLIAARAHGRRCCYSITDDTGRTIQHGHAKVTEGHNGYHGLLTEITHRLDAKEPGLGDTSALLHVSGSVPAPQHATNAYRPSASLRHLIETRDRTCRFPACRRPAHYCDLDHTLPYENGGSTCACNLAPLCRKHHRLKQAQGWRLTQPAPGRLTWITPSGRQYPVLPDPYPPAGPMPADDVADT